MCPHVLFSQAQSQIRKTAHIKFPSVDEPWMNITDTAHPTINASLLMTTNKIPQ